MAASRTKRTPARQVEAFIKKANQLPNRASFVFLSRYQASISISGGTGLPLTISNLRKPETEEYRSYLIDFRRFVSPDEEIFVNKILNLCIVCCTDPGFRGELQEMQKDWKNSWAMMKPQTTEYPDGTKKETSGETLFFKWLNGTIFHSNEEDEEYFESSFLMDLFEVDASKFVGWRSNFIVYLANKLQAALKNNWFDFSLITK